MSGRTDHGLATRMAGIAAVVAVMVAVILLVAPGLVPVASAPATAVVPLLVPGPPIAAEADVFRTRPGDLAADPGAERRAEAHPRTMALYRSLRAYPGAPPRIPHGLTAEEFKGARCNTCHQRGGFVERFAAYAPVTPHPELTQCLQCHVPDGDLVGLPFTAASARAPVCFQCHLLDAERPLFTALDWPAPAWPESHPAALPGAPPAIPHGLQLRGNCLACHMGAAALEEIRTTHPDRPGCRQCHVPAGDPVDAFARPAGGAGPGGGAG
ncbi:MAG TPA: hypothetical protein VMM12_02105 [Longimicrobiales bacterium]|nr:hypothetical protein [Longimicrobiales bacterium]